MRPSPSSCRLGLRGYSLSGSPRVHLRYGPATRTPPAEGVVNGLQVIRFPSCLPSSYRASDCYPDGTDPRWTQQPFLDAQPCVRLSPHTALPLPVELRLFRLSNLCISLTFMATIPPRWHSATFAS